jgi:rRNA maturation RNase YbeY
MIQFIVEDTSQPQFDEKKIIRWINQVAIFHKKKVGKINYIFCSDSRILEVNRQFLQHDYFTDIITFDYGNGNIISGDIFISIDTVLSNAKELNLDFFQELYRVIIHGVLHLCGQDDRDEQSQKEMTRKENEAIDLLAAQ